MASIDFPFATQHLGIRYGEAPGYSEDFDGTRPASRRILLTNWLDVKDFPVAMLGDVKVAAGGGGFNRTVPEKHPKPAFGYCQELRLREGLGAPVQDSVRKMIAYQDLVNKTEGVAVWEATYYPVPWAIKGDDAIGVQIRGGDAGLGEGSRYITKELEFGMEVYQLPGCSYEWRTKQPSARTGKPITDTIPEGIPYQRPIDSLKYIWRMVPEPVPRRFLSIVGKINKDSFDGYGAGTLLCGTPEMSETKFTASGSPYRDIVFNLHFRPDSGWNTFYRKDLNDFDLIVEKKTGKIGPYRTGDFGELFAV